MSQDEDSKKSPQYEVIKRKIMQSGLSDTIQLYSYEDKGHFKELWGFGSSLSNNTIVIVWDGIAGTIPEGMPGSLVDTSQYLTPIDWAVGYSLSIKDGTEKGNYPDLKILIYDSASDKVSRSDSVKFVYQSSNMDVMSMPWIRIFSAKTPVSSRNSVALFRLLTNLNSADAKAINSHKGSSCSTSMPVEEDKEPTPISFERDTPFTESQFLGLRIDAILTNISRLVNSFRGSVEAIELSPVGDDKALEPPLDNQVTQPPDSEHNTEICDE
ncbi:MAG: hypothetical protein HOI47_05920, partial [Candidatus Scalindua sp.]|nr:hypothetical protein [Candidatus Scalindua sp.]